MSSSNFLSNDGLNIVFSIVAIHGLDGHPIKSWTAANGTLWLRDLLPEKIPRARILTYGYDAYARGRDQLADESVYAIAQKLLVDLATERHDSHVSTKSTINIHTDLSLVTDTTTAHNLCGAQSRWRCS